MLQWGSVSGSKLGCRVSRLFGRLEVPIQEQAFQNSVWHMEARQTRVALGIGIVFFMASLAIEYFRIGQGEAFFWSALARGFFLLVCNLALFASLREKPGALMAWSLVGAAAVFALCGAVTILVGGLPWQDYAATTAMAMIYMAVFVPNRPAHAMLSVVIMAFAYIGLLPFLASSGNVVRLVIVESVVLFVCLAAIRRSASIGRASFLRNIQLLAAQDSSRAELSDAHFQRQTFEEVAVEGVTLMENLQLAREDAEQQSTFLRAVLDNISQGVFVFDKEMNLAAWNQRLIRMLDIPEVMLKVGTPLADIIRFNAGRGEYGDGDGDEIAAAQIEKIEAQSGVNAHHYERRRPGGTVVDVRGNPMPGGGLVTTYTDITERKNAEDVMRKMALRDALTGIANRNAFNRQLQAEIEKAGQGEGKFALVVLDLDDFKPVNDKYGHPVGDRLLCHVAEVIDAGIRHGDMAARLGGDEFAMILKNIRDRDLAEELVRRIVEKLAQPISLDGHDVQISASAGISIFPTDASSAEDMICKADKALYGAKAGGKNQLKLAAG